MARSSVPPRKRIFAYLHVLRQGEFILELVEDCSAEQFLLAFRRFVGRRGLPRVIMSDNAKNFKRSAKEITKIGRSTLVQEHLANIGVNWMFIVEKAPWWGGFWERLVRITKDCIKKSVGRALLTYEQLRTLLLLLLLLLFKHIYTR